MSKSSSEAVQPRAAASEFIPRIDDPIQHLLRCHEQIERCLLNLECVAMTVGFSEGAMRQDAAAALDYEFGILETIDRLHTEDEEESLFPRLRANLGNDTSLLDELMLSLELQHRDEQAAFAKLKEAVKNAASPQSQPAEGQVSSCEDLVRELAAICAPHMTLENERLIPLARRVLTPADLEEIRREMRRRWGV